MVIWPALCQAMGKYNSYISFGCVVAVGYAAFGFFFQNFDLELLLLGAAIIVIAGMIPNIDSRGEAPAREVGALLAAIAPVIVLELFPGVRSGGAARVALVVLGSYILTRVIVVRVIHRYTQHRGMLHSIPAAILTFELVYLLFWDLYFEARLYLASAAFIGYLSHLMLDAYGNLDFMGKAFGTDGKKQPALKFFGGNWGPTIAMYLTVVFFGWQVMEDLYPYLVYSN